MGSQPGGVATSVGVSLDLIHILHGEREATQRASLGPLMDALLHEPV